MPKRKPQLEAVSFTRDGLLGQLPFLLYPLVYAKRTLVVGYFFLKEQLFTPQNFVPVSQPDGKETHRRPQGIFKAEAVAICRKTRMLT